MGNIIEDRGREEKKDCANIYPVEVSGLDRGSLTYANKPEGRNQPQATLLPFFYEVADSTIPLRRYTENTETNSTASLVKPHRQ